MDVLWDSGQSTVRDVISHIESNPAYTTIATVLTKLVRKELVVADREKHSTRYSALLGREEYAACVMARKMLLAKDRGAALRYFTEFLSEDDLDSLRDHLMP